MKTTGVNKQKGSDTDKAIARPGLGPSKASKSGNSSKVSANISQDSILAEKDEVKMAEEKLRQRVNKQRTSKGK